MHRSTPAILLAVLGMACASPVGTVQPRQADFSGNQQDGLNGACQPMIVIFARGTTERGNVGTLAGPPFFQALSAQMGGGLAVQGVEYPANVQGFLAGGDAKGSQTMVTLTKQALTKCPDSSVIISGYSQGGQLVHNAAAMMPKDMVSKVAGALIFGDPMNGQAVKGIPRERTVVFCHDGDNICEGGSQIRRAHLTYGDNAAEAAQYAAAMTRPGAAAAAAA
ncbi:cutinase [Colletotrichum falcatum]|nr:cutinase [Colletotrichum falcatum]